MRGANPLWVIRRQSAARHHAVDVGMRASALTIPCAQKPRTFMFFIPFTRSMVLPFRSSEDRSEGMARSQSQTQRGDG
jgi:hypothetical protein